MPSSDIIKLLPDAIANQIAAGEVVQRPASVVKELLENAIDAGAKKISLLLKDGGKTLIQVIDDGSGMSPTDARMCFERHATSKITAAADLFRLRTMGFRGEALASIAAIAHVELKTRRAEDNIGTLIDMQGSKVKEQSPCQWEKGTSIAVKNLFFNVPARRQFLKADNVELRHCLEEFERVVLAYPDLTFILNHNGTEMYHLRSGNIKQRIIGLFGSNYNERLVPIAEDIDFLHISGFIGKPKFAKKLRGEQFFFVNSRFIKSQYLHGAVMAAYENLLPKEHFPLYCIYIKIDPNKIDVNIHPTKQEIKFEDERVVYTFVHAAVKHALSSHSITPSLDFEQEASLSFGALGKAAQPDAIVGGSPSALPEKTPSSPLFTPNKSTTPQKTSDIGKKSSGKVPIWETLYVPPKSPQSEEKTPESNTATDETAAHTATYLSKSSTATPEKNDETTAIFALSAAPQMPTQLHKRYILSQIKSGFILIDQQAAHERILYEKYLLILEQGTVSIQKLLFPQAVKMSVADTVTLQNMLPQIAALGYEVEYFGGTDFVVHGVPSDIAGGNEQAIFEDLVQQFSQAPDLKLSARNRLAQVIAKHNAIKNGTLLQAAEMKNLIDQLFACEVPYISFNGNATFIQYRLDDIEKEFKKGV
ncbi:MAG: DNA mismatch repair endonuclease MutL [Sphingobacteriales bacterium]|nr:DNA mismatch repair endonuclease MutL [Sphingobacteriales bacterium]